MLPLHGTGTLKVSVWLRPIWNILTLEVYLTALPIFETGTLKVCSGGTFQATARFQDSALFQKSIKMVLRCIFNVIFHVSGFKLSISTCMTFKTLNGMWRLKVCDCVVQMLWTLFWTAKMICLTWPLLDLEQSVSVCVTSPRVEHEDEVSVCVT